ncbi:hypothetical protein A4H97_26290 [Niastella yeongjuensis]|uniref:Uncharacterized protein n=1 Tax=Niastella yeongjuensis TaxID=354355 RepID=A0A1V9F0F2_9BACT|nr:hypothetical protein A4H97_26290 [Niastella yeongjuensis]
MLKNENPQLLTTDQKVSDLNPRGHKKGFPNQTRYQSGFFSAVISFIVNFLKGIGLFSMILWF